MSKRYNKLPSEIANIDDSYVAFCFDEACEYMIAKLEDKKKPIFYEDTVDNLGKRKTFLAMAMKKKEGEK